MFRLALCIFLSALQLLISSEGWIHLELGAGNYGERGEMPEAGVRPKFDPMVQYKVLFWTLDQLIERNGPIGIFQVNDVKESYMKYAMMKLQEYAEIQGYDQITIEGCPGDFFKIDFSPYLIKHGRNLYDSIHLKNPEAILYRGPRKNYDNYAKKRQAGRGVLQRIADFSSDGLYFFTLYTAYFFPDIEKEEFVDQGIFYLETDQWEPVDYYHPNGDMLKDGRVFFIQSRNAL